MAACFDYFWFEPINRKNFQGTFVMKHTLLLGMGLLIATSGNASRALADGVTDTARVEIPVKALLTPAVGYEEKNNIEVVLYGQLPNSCYTVSENLVEKQISGNSIWVRQYAIRDFTGICADESTLPEHMKLPVPFTTEVSVGHLAAGPYRFNYNKLGEGTTSREMNVSKNVTPTGDTLPYAAVSATHSPDVVNGKDRVKVKVSGVLNSSCTRLDSHVRVVKEDDVFVLLPTVKVERGVLCMQMLIPFEKEVDLGTTQPGIHLIHTRSMNGKSVNKVIQVAK